MVDEAIAILEAIGIDTSDDELQSIIAQCPDERLLRCALDVIADDVGETPYDYPTDYAVQIIFQIAIQPFNDVVFLASKRKS